MKRSIKRLTAGILAAALLSLCGCGGKKAAEPEMTEIEHGYITEYLSTDLERDFGLTGIYQYGDSIYLTSYFDESHEDETGGYIMDEGIRLYALDETQQPKLLRELRNAYENDPELSTANSTEIRSFAPDTEGGCWYLEATTFIDWSAEDVEIESRIELVHAAADGTELVRADFGAMLPDDMDSDYVYVEALSVSESGVMLRGSDFVVLTDTEGRRTALYTWNMNEMQNGYLQDCVFTGAGDLVSLYYEYSETSSRTLLKRITENGMEDIGELPIPYCSHIVAGSGHTVLLDGGTSLYRYDIEAKTCEELLNWLNSDINSNKLLHLFPAEDGSFLISETADTGGTHYGINGFSMYDGKVRLSRLTPPEAGKGLRRAVINLAAMYIDSNLQDAIIGFNRQNSVYRICFRDYSVYNTEENYELGLQTLAKEIAAGNLPDLFFTDGLPLVSLARQGNLMDIGKLIDEDETMQRSDYAENILKALEIDGKLYTVVPSYTLQTITGKTENVGDRTNWTLSDLKTLCEKYPEASVMGYTDRSEILYEFETMALGQYVDAEKGVCNFRTQEFYDFLAFAASMPESINWDEVYGEDYDWEAEENALRDNRQLLEREYLYGFDDCRYLEYRFGGDYSYVGFPVPAGCGTAVVPSLELAVSAKTPYREACTEFIRYLLSEEYQNFVEYSFPMLRSSLNKMAEKAQQAKKQDRWSYYEDGDVRGLPASAEQTAKILSLIASVQQVSRMDDELTNIITEELAPYFAGQQSAESVTEKLQSRVSLYLSEKQ